MTYRYICLSRATAVRACGRRLRAAAACPSSPGRPGSGRQRCSWTRPGSTRSRPRSVNQRSTVAAVPEDDRDRADVVPSLARDREQLVRRRLHDDQVAAGRPPPRPARPARPSASSRKFRMSIMTIADRLGEVERPAGPGDDRGGVAGVGVEEADAAFGRAQQGARVRQHHRVVVDVDDAAGRVDRLGDLVRVAGRGHAGADVEELPYPGLGGQVGHRPAQERAGGRPELRHRRGDGDQQLGGPAVGLEVIAAAHQVVPDPRDVRRGGVDLDRPHGPGRQAQPLLGRHRRPTPSPLPRERAQERSHELRPLRGHTYHGLALRTGVNAAVF